VGLTIATLHLFFYRIYFGQTDTSSIIFLFNKSCCVGLDTITLHFFLLKFVSVWSTQFLCLLFGRHIFTSLYNCFLMVYIWSNF